MGCTLGVALLSVKTRELDENVQFDTPSYELRHKSKGVRSLEWRGPLKPSISGHLVTNGIKKNSKKLKKTLNSSSGPLSDANLVRVALLIRSFISNLRIEKISLSTFSCVFVKMSSKEGRKEASKQASKQR